MSAIQSERLKELVEPKILGRSEGKSMRVIDNRKLKNAE